MDAVKLDVPVFNAEEAATAEADSGCDWASYRDFTDNVRARYFDPNQELRQHFDIKLRTHSHQIKLRFEIEFNPRYYWDSTFEVVGYQMDHPHHQWLEFGFHHTWRKYPPVHYIHGSTFLEMKKDYSDIENAIGEGQTINGIDIGQQQLITAVNLLATTMIRQDRAWSLIVVILMICKAIKFPAISNYLAATFLQTRSLPQHLINLFHTCNILNKLQIKPYPELTATPAAIRSLVEVLLVCVNSINGKCSGDYFYGTISVMHHYYAHQHIYNRAKEGAEFVYPGDNLLLNVQNVCLQRTCDYLEFNFVVFGKKLPYSPQIYWHSIRGIRGRHDQPISEDFVIDNCSLTLTYIAFRYAKQAIIEVTLMDLDGRGGNGNDPVVAHVYGKISACLAKFDNYEMALFQKTSKEHLDVCPGELLELSRSAIAVPYDSSLIIQVELYEDEGELSIAKGIAEFPTQQVGTFDRNISGTCSTIRLRVTWIGVIN